MKQRPQRPGSLPTESKDYYCQKHFKPAKFIFKNATLPSQLLCQNCYQEFPEFLLKHVITIEE